MRTGASSVAGPDDDVAVQYEVGLFCTHEVLVSRVLRLLDKRVAQLLQERVECLLRSWWDLNTSEDLADI